MSLTGKKLKKDLTPSVDLCYNTYMSRKLKPYKCKRCGEERPEKFYGSYKTTCGKCQRVRKRLYQRQYYRQWYAENGRARNEHYQEGILEWQEEHPDRVRACEIISYAVKTGKINKPESCETCHRITRLSAHHKDYSEPLEVVWLCSSCHKLIHPVNGVDKIN